MSYAYWEQTRVRQDPPAPVAVPGRKAAAGSRRFANVAPVQLFAGVFGAVFVLVGILGFIPGITTMFGSFGLLGRSSKSELLGLFEVSVAHNVVHLLFGVGLLAARKATTARLYLIAGGALYMVVALYGTVVDQSSAANFIPFNTADNVLHFGLSAAMIALGIIGGAMLRRASMARS